MVCQFTPMDSEVLQKFQTLPGPMVSSQWGSGGSLGQLDGSPWCGPAFEYGLWGRWKPWPQQVHPQSFWSECVYSNEGSQASQLREDRWRRVAACASRPSGPPVASGPRSFARYRAVRSAWQRGQSLGLVSAIQQQGFQRIFVCHWRLQAVVDRKEVLRAGVVPQRAQVDSEVIPKVPCISGAMVSPTQECGGSVDQYHRSSRCKPPRKYGVWQWIFQPPLQVDSPPLWSQRFH
mmetsp:Transcript_81663/g.218505  ORF Transcript_81663/g.218505 Transcript_81663/m.218505 type:complete len:234 (-) Transcript_81663:3034-3735(-)